MRWELAPPRHAPPRTGEGEGCLSAWLSVALRVKVAVAEWRHEEDAWVHWAAPLGSDGAPVASLRSCDLGSRAMRPGEPAGRRHSLPTWRLDETRARQLITETLSAWTPALHRQGELGVVSSLDEDLGQFRRRCFAPLRPLLATRAAGSGEAVALLAGAFESRPLSAAEVAIRLVRFGVVWFAPGWEPVRAAGDPMLEGVVRARR